MAEVFYLRDYQKEQRERESGKLSPYARVTLRIARAKRKVSQRIIRGITSGLPEIQDERINNFRSQGYQSVLLTGGETYSTTFDSLGKIVIYQGSGIYSWKGHEEKFSGLDMICIGEEDCYRPITFKSAVKTEMYIQRDYGDNEIEPLRTTLRPGS